MRRYTIRGKGRPVRTHLLPLPYKNVRLPAEHKPKGSTPEMLLFWKFSSTKGWQRAMDKHKVTHPTHNTTQHSKGYLC